MSNIGRFHALHSTNLSGRNLAFWTQNKKKTYLQSWWIFQPSYRTGGQSYRPRHFFEKKTHLIVLPNFVDSGLFRPTGRVQNLLKWLLSPTSRNNPPLSNTRKHTERLQLRLFAFPLVFALMPLPSSCNFETNIHRNENAKTHWLHRHTLILKLKMTFLGESLEIILSSSSKFYLNFQLPCLNVKDRPKRSPASSLSEFSNSSRNFPQNGPWNKTNESLGP